MKRNEVSRLLRKGKLAGRAAAIEPLVLDSIRVRPAPLPRQAQALGASRLGGLPDLPPGLAWPRQEDIPLSFLAQFDMADLAPFTAARQLPPIGILYFFYDAEDQPWGFDPAHEGGWRVLYCADPRTITGRAEAPDGLDTRFEARAVRLSEDSTLPDVWNEEMASLKLSQAELDAYLELEETVQPDLTEALPTIHRLLGHPDQIQSDMREDIQLASRGVYAGDSSQRGDPRVPALLKGVNDWMMLFQIDSDEELGTEWGDAGRVYFWIRRQDLARADFSRAWAVLQCG